MLIYIRNVPKGTHKNVTKIPRNISNILPCFPSRGSSIKCVIIGVLIRNFYINQTELG